MYLRLAGWLSVGLAVSLLFVSAIRADIYRYQDADGVWHFTNVRTDTRYNLYIRTTRKTPAQYIKAYKPIINQASRRFQVEPALVKAVIHAESGFDSQAISVKGAQGLMQLMPQTADEMDVSRPFSPEENIFGGTRYLSLLLGRFENDKRLALAAYNAGPDRVEACGGIPPIKETRNFVKRVMEYYRAYRQSP